MQAIEILNRVPDSAGGKGGKVISSSTRKVLSRTAIFFTFKMSNKVTAGPGLFELERLSEGEVTSTTQTWPDTCLDVHLLYVYSRAPSLIQRLLDFNTLQV